MKNIFIYCILATLVLACKKKDTELINGEKPEVRIAKLMAEYKADIQSTTGWKVYIKTNSGAGYGYYCVFTPNDRVKMISDDFNASSENFYESTYRLRAVMTPSIIFDTYSYLHLLSDPDPNRVGGGAGVGLEADFEFELQRKSGDTIFAKGKRRRAEIMFIKATAAEKIKYETTGYTQAIENTYVYFDDHSNLYINEASGSKHIVFIGLESKTIAFTNLAANGTIKSSQTSSFAYTLNGIILLDSIIINGEKITDIVFDGTKMIAKTASGKSFELVVSATSLIPLISLIGTAGFEYVVLPPVTSFEGWSPDFTTRYLKATNSMKTGPYGLTLGYSEFKFNATSKKVTLTLELYQGASLYIGNFIMNYTVNVDNTISFAKDGANYNAGNAGLVTIDMDPLLAERLLTDKFTLQFFQHSTLGNIAQFKSIEHPDFYFTGDIN